MADFAERLHLIRSMREMSLEQMAEILGTSKQVLNRYELRKRYPKTTTVRKYADALGIDAAWLIGYDDEKHSSPENPIKDQLCKYIDGMSKQQMDLMMRIAKSIREDGNHAV